MREPTTGSTVPRRQLGRFLRDARQQARLTVRAAARNLEWSETKMWRIETGQVSLRSHDVDTMCRVYGVAPGLTDALKGLAKETKARGWWHAYGDVIPDWFDVYVGLEEAAQAINIYQSELVPGLFQTAGYARVVIGVRGVGADAEDLERRVLLRMTRQSLVTRVTDPTQLNVVVNEAVLRRPVGGTQVMAGQLTHLAALSELPNVTLRVVPFAAGHHIGINSGPFTILRFPTDGDGDATEPPTVYVEGITGALYLDQSYEVDRFQQYFDDILRTIGDHSGQRSRDMLRAAAKEFRR